MCLGRQRQLEVLFESRDDKEGDWSRDGIACALQKFISNAIRSRCTSIFQSLQCLFGCLDSPPAAGAQSFFLHENIVNHNLSDHFRGPRSRLKAYAFHTFRRPNLDETAVFYKGFGHFFALSISLEFLPSDRSFVTKITKVFYFTPFLKTFKPSEFP